MAIEREIKPCPFCGGPAVVDNLLDDNDYYVHCRDCEVQQIANHSHEAAIELWNNRTHVQSLIDEAVKAERQRQADATYNAAKQQGE